MASRGPPVWRARAGAVRRVGPRGGDARGAREL